MTPTIPSLVLGMLAFTAAGAVSAQQQTLAPVEVDTAVRHIDCTPPSYIKQCSDFHAQIRANFSKREVSMLFGAATSHPEYLTTYDWVKKRYWALVADYEAANNVSVSMKVNADSQRRSRNLASTD